MKMRPIFSFPSALILVAVMFIASGCTDVNYPYGGGGYNDPYSGGYSGGYRDHDYGYDRRHDWDDDRHEREERRDLERERDQIEEERRQVEEERRRHEVEEQREHQQREERCPSGWQQTEQKCSQEERRHGCKDVRLSNGIGCVRR